MLFLISYTEIDALAAMFRRQAARKNTNGKATRRRASKRASVVEVIDLTSPSPPPEIRSSVQEVTEMLGGSRSHIGDAGAEDGSSVYEDARDDIAISNTEFYGEV